MPTVSTVASDMGINPTYGKVAQAVLSTLAPPLGMAMTGYGVVAQANNTANNSAMLGRMGDPLGFGQIAGGVLGLNGYGGTPEGAMNSAMATPAGRAALSPSQLGGENPGVSMPTQTAPVTPVSSQQLGAPRGLSSDNGGSGDSGGGAARGYGAVANGTAVGSQNSSNDPTGMGGMAHGGQVRGSARGKPNTNVIIVMPHPIMGALMMAALHNRMQPQHLATGALPARRR